MTDRTNQPNQPTDQNRIQREVTLNKSELLGKELVDRTSDERCCTIACRYIFFLHFDKIINYPAEGQVAVSQAVSKTFFFIQNSNLSVLFVFPLKFSNDTILQFKFS